MMEKCGWKWMSDSDRGFTWCSVRWSFQKESTWRRFWNCWPHQNRNSFTWPKIMMDSAGDKTQKLTECKQFVRLEGGRLLCFLFLMNLSSRLQFDEPGTLKKWTFARWNITDAFTFKFWVVVDARVVIFSGIWSGSVFRVPGRVLQLLILSGIGLWGSGFEYHFGYLVKIGS